MQKGILFCMGNPLLDISANVEEDLLEKYNLKANDAILATEEHTDLYMELKDKFDCEYIAGGATQNSCRVFQWILQEPERCVFLGCIGKDEFGKILEQKAREAGVNVQYQYDANTPTGTCAVLLTQKGTNRSLCANLGAANCFQTDHLLKAENQKLMQEAKFYYISGFFLTVSVSSMVHVGAHAAASNKVFCMNLSAPFLCSVFKENMMKVMPFVDILFGNESEAAEFAKNNDWAETEVADIAKKITSLPKENSNRSRMVVFTQGSESVIVVNKDGVQKFPVVKLNSEEIVDTNGAGDAFVGGFFACYVQGKDIGDCVASGISAATMMIRQSGCSLPDRSTYNA